MNYISNYKQMRIFIIYDLPMVEEIDHKIYNKFHKNLKKNGFYMLQYSVYVKVLQNETAFLQINNKINSFVPKKGRVIILKITEKQFQNIIYLRGERNLFEKIVGGNELVIFRDEKFD